MTSMRESLADQLRPLLPKRWQFLDTETSVPAGTDVVTVQLKLQRVARWKTQSKYHSTWVLTVRDPLTDMRPAELALDDELILFLAACDKVNPSLWTGAEKVLSDDRLAYDVTLELLTDKEVTP